MDKLLAALEVHTLVMAVVMVVMAELTAAVAVLVGIPVQAVQAVRMAVTDLAVLVVVAAAHTAVRM
jgi:hypothetical protein